MSALEPLLSLGQSAAIPEKLSRRIRIANAIALLGAALTIASVPFDLATGPRWFLLSDLVALAAFVACWILNARGHRDAARVVMLLAANLVFSHATISLGEASDQRVVFFALAIAPFLVFGLDERRWLVPLVALPIAAYFVTELVASASPPPFAVAAYRVYSAVLAFSALVGGVLVFARITHRAERALQAKQRLLDDARARSIGSARMAALGEMSSGVAHEIRNPLTALDLAAEQLVEQAREPERVAATAARVQRVTLRISRIVDALLSFARDAGGDPVTPVAVEQIFADALALCRQRFVEHAIDLSVAPPAASLIVECRPVQLAQVLLNLLGNAHDAAQAAPERWVRLAAEVTDGSLQISVTDSGAGIPAMHRERIFEPFFTTKPSDRGTGLGLSLSRGIVEAHHGTLTLDERSAHTRFVIRMPLVQPPAARTSPARSER